MRYPIQQTILRRFVAVAFSLLIMGCATRPTPIPHDIAMRMHRVAVISLTAKVFTRKYTGFTVFGNERDVLNISDWNTDEQYEAQLATELEKFPGITVIKAPYSIVEFSHVNDSRFFRSDDPNWGAIENATRKYCSRNSLDGVLVLGSAEIDDFLAKTNQRLSGAGTYTTHGMRGKVSVMHLISRMALFDCKTAKPIAIRTISNNQSGAIIYSAPILMISQDISRRPIAQWSDEQRQQVRAQLSSLPGNAWSATLRSIFPAEANKP